MSTREQALYIFNRLTEEQLAAFVTLFSGDRFVLEEAPDEWDKKMIADSKRDNSEGMPFNDFVKELGFNPNELRN